jgi:hypothetical protein
MKRKLKESEILPYINKGKVIEQFLGEFYQGEYRCLRYVSVQKEKDSYFGLIFEVFDESNEGVDSIYDYSSVEPDDLFGVEIGTFETLTETLESIRGKFNLHSDRYLISGHLDEEIKTESYNK